MVGLDHGGKPVGDGRPGGADQGGGESAALAQTKGHESGRPFIEDRYRLQAWFFLAG